MVEEEEEEEEDGLVEWSVCLFLAGVGVCLYTVCVCMLVMWYVVTQLTTVGISIIYWRNLYPRN